jgi:hypothetical protein
MAIELVAAHDRLLAVIELVDIAFSSGDEHQQRRAATQSILPPLAPFGRKRRANTGGRRDDELQPVSFPISPIPGRARVG